MTELSFSAIGDTNEDIEEITRLVKEFQNTSQTSDSCKTSFVESCLANAIDVCH